MAELGVAEFFVAILAYGVTFGFFAVLIVYLDVHL